MQRYFRIEEYLNDWVSNTTVEHAGIYTVRTNLLNTLQKDYLLAIMPLL